MKNLFLYGKSQIGKSTFLFDVLQEKDVLTWASGYYTKRVLNLNGEIVGYSHHAIEDFNQLEEQTTKATKNQFMFLRNEQVLDFDLTVFHSFTNPLLENALKKCTTDKIQHFIVLDEIGGMELTDLNTRNILIKVLNSNVPCIGITKSPTAIKKMQHSNELLKILFNGQKTELINANLFNKHTLKNSILTWIKNNKIGEQINNVDYL